MIQGYKEAMELWDHALHFSSCAEADEQKVKRECEVLKMELQTLTHEVNLLRKCHPGRIPEGCCTVLCVALQNFSSGISIYRDTVPMSYQEDQTQLSVASQQYMQVRFRST